MGSPVVISRSLLEAICADARSDAVRERCGLLLGDGAAILDFVSCANVHHEPERNFELDPGTLIAAYRAERMGGPAVVGHYHSHPTAEAAPSLADAAAACDDGRLWLIVSRDDIRLWRSVAGGALHGRFEAVAVHLIHVDKGRPGLPNRALRPPY